MSKKEKRNLILLLLLLGVMVFIDAIIQPNYLIKSICKLTLFLIIPMLLIKLGIWEIKYPFLQWDKKKMKWPLLLGFGIIIVILGSYFLLGRFFDFSQVTVSLGEKYLITKSNFIFVALYIACVNSLLEEFFFRGLLFMNVSKNVPKSWRYLGSSFLFAVYHIAIMQGWFSIWLTLLLIAALMVAGMLFDWLSEHAGSIFGSWVPHAFANIAINFIGLLLFLQ